ncbi:hypothetical protein [Enterobacter asburiae]|jgi:hypothetical protein|uniref:hypothetical protein n=1 Tax=Enterobacter asburiae TaxID=61645 RepID=UPI00075D0FFE|nr:hypothetical protein [Enterobacter asburiae]KVJ87415.1 hypothetical protein AWS24_20380 [Enterobacter asburiae]DAL49598.1 MAG TPA_asm: hypothetical protein [Caudoviricetes sp.]
MSIKNLVEMIKHNGLLASMSELEELYQVAIQNEQKLAESDARCAALAAENAGLKSAIETHKHGFVRCNCCGDELMCHTDDVCRALDETPATDAFLAEVRAQGVEMAACALDDVNQFNYANMLDDLAQKIRQEAAQ